MREVAPLQGMRNVFVVRPFLRVPRAEILTYARARRLAWVEDEDNLNLARKRIFCGGSCCRWRRGSFQTPARRRGPWRPAFGERRLAAGSGVFGFAPFRRRGRGNRRGVGVGEVAGLGEPRGLRIFCIQTCPKWARRRRSGRRARRRGKLFRRVRARGCLLRLGGIGWWRAEPGWRGPGVRRKRAGKKFKFFCRVFWR